MRLPLTRELPTQGHGYFPARCRWAAADGDFRRIVGNGSAWKRTCERCELAIACAIAPAVVALGKASDVVGPHLRDQRLSEMCGHAAAVGFIDVAEGVRLRRDRAENAERKQKNARQG